jgi:hypothetical protein
MSTISIRYIRVIRWLQFLSNTHAVLAPAMDEAVLCGVLSQRTTRAMFVFREFRWQ